MRAKRLPYVDALDLVPLLPSVSLIANLYTHCLNEEVLQAPEGTATVGASDVVKSMAGRAADGILSMTLIDEFWGQVTNRIAHHMVDNYQARIDERCKTSS